MTNRPIQILSALEQEQHCWAWWEVLDKPWLSDRGLRGTYDLSPFQLVQSFVVRVFFVKAMLLVSLTLRRALNALHKIGLWGRTEYCSVRNLFRETIEAVFHADGRSGKVSATSERHKLWNTEFNQCCPWRVCSRPECCLLLSWPQLTEHDATVRQTAYACTFWLHFLRWYCTRMSWRRAKLSRR